MSIKTALISIVSLSILLPTMAAAQTGPKAGEATGKANQNTNAPKVQVMDIEGEDIESGIIRPGGERFTPNQHKKTSSLIDIKTNFIPELLNSVNDI